jgi:hypothetical protein
VRDGAKKKVKIEANREMRKLRSDHDLNCYGAGGGQKTNPRLTRLIIFAVAPASRDDEDRVLAIRPKR